MADQAQLEQLIRMLLNAAGGSSGFGGSQGLPSNLNLANVGQYQPSMLSSLLGGALPSFQSQAPPTMLASHFEEVQKRSAWRSRVNDFYMGYSPTAVRALEKLGVQKNALVDDMGQPTSMGRWVSMGWNSLMGPMLGDPQGFKGQMASNMRDMYQGVYFGRHGNMSGYGLSDREIEGQINSLHNLTYKDQAGLFRRSSFDSRDMFEVQSLGVRRGLMVGADAGQLTNRTEGLAKTIQTGMAVFNTLNKEKVLENLQRITQGTVGLSNTGSLDALMHKVAGLAKAANVSVETMSRIAAEGASIYKSLGIVGTGGVSAHMNAAVTGQLLTSRVAGMNPVISSDTVSRAGGVRNVVGLVQQQAAGFAGSRFFQNAAFFARADLGGVSEGIRSNMMAGTMTAGDIRRGVDALASKIAGQTGVDMHTARQLARADMIANRSTAASEELADMQERGGGFDFALTQNKAQFEKLTSRMPTNLKKFLTNPAKNERQRQLQIAFLSKKLMVRAGGDPHQARVLAEQMLGMAQGESKVIEGLKQTFNNEQLSQAAAEAKELYRPTSSAAERVMSKISAKRGQTTLGDFMSAVFMGDGSVMEKFIRDRGATSEELDTIVKKFRPTDYYMSQVLFSTPQEKQVQAIMAGIAGTQVLDLETALSSDNIDLLQSAMGKRKSLDEEDIVKTFGAHGQDTAQAMDRLKSSFSSFFQNKEINQKTMSSFVQTSMGMTVEQANKWLGQSDNVAALLKLGDKSDMGGKVSRLARGVQALHDNKGVVGDIRAKLSGEDAGKVKEIIQKMLAADDPSNAGLTDAEKALFDKFSGPDGLKAMDIPSQKKLLEALQIGAEEHKNFLREKEDEAVSDTSDKLLSDIKKVYDMSREPTAAQEKLASEGFKKVLGQDLQEEHKKELVNAFQTGGFKGLTGHFRTLVNRSGNRDFAMGDLTSEMTASLLKSIGVTKDSEIQVGDKRVKVGDIIDRQEQQEGGMPTLIGLFQQLYDWLKSRFGNMPIINTEPKVISNPEAK